MVQKLRELIAEVSPKPHPLKNELSSIPNRVLGDLIGKSASSVSLYLNGILPPSNRDEQKFMKLANHLKTDEFEAYKYIAQELSNRKRKHI